MPRPKKQEISTKEIRLMCRKDEDTGCLIWPGRVLRSKKRVYPIVYRNGRNEYVARIAWQVRHNITLSSTTAIANTCGTDRCVNPDHHTARPVGKSLEQYPGGTLIHSIISE